MSNSVKNISKWYKKVFFHLLDLSILNSCSLYKTKTKEKINLADFHLKLTTELLGKFHQPRVRRKTTSVESPLRLTERHFPRKVPASEKKKNAARKCVVCSKKKLRKESVYECEKCNVGLCVVPCFEIFHTQKNY